MGARIADFDWSKTVLGPISGWPQSLRTAVALTLHSAVPMAILWGSDGVMLYNDAYSVGAGRRHPQLLGTRVLDGWPELAELNTEVLRVVLGGGTLTYRDQEHTLFRNGAPEQVFTNLDYSPIHDESGHPAGVIAIVVETTDKVVAERWRTDERERLRQMFAQAPGFMAMLHGPEHVFQLINPAYLQLAGHRDVIGKPVREAMPDIAGQGFYELLDSVYASGEAVVGTGVKATLQPVPGGPSEERYVDIVYQPVRDLRGEVMGVFVQGADVTERVLAERALQQSEFEFRTFAQVMTNHVWAATAGGALDWFNAQVYAYSGATEDELSGGKWIAFVHPDDVPGATARWFESLRTGAVYETEFRLRRADGVYRWHISRAAPIRSHNGEIVRWVGTNTDIEEQKMTAEALARLNETLELRVNEEIAERRLVQAALAQVQKMEAIGNLTGGVAHDFNNLLQVISGNLQLLAKDIAGNARAERRVANALAGVSRGSRLAAQLLAFGRRQPLAPKVINIGRFVTGMDDMLRRSLGEAVEIETIVSGGLWNTFADPTQIENAVLNLAINARDAMEGGGKLTIEVGNASIDDSYARTRADVNPGQYVLLAVTDTGTGIPPELIEKVFEPFFTTKPEGRGTGLGLSMVYGFVKQSGGHVQIYSELGQGTTVKIYLPRAMEAEDRISPVEPAGPVQGGSETILVAEDDEEVRSTVVDLLVELGYRVLKAKDAADALAVIDSGVSVDLLFTDVVMPGPLKSPELARKVQARLPNTKVLFTSGYTENSIVHEGRLDPGVELLSKPYTREDLARKVRQVLGPARVEAAPAAPTTAAPGLKILVVEDDALIRMNTVEMLQEFGHEVAEAGHGAGALEHLGQRAFDLVITDLGLPDVPGEVLVARIRGLYPELCIVVATGSDTERPEGAAAVLRKPYEARALREAVQQARPPRG